MDKYVFRNHAPSARRIAALNGITNAINHSKLMAQKEIEKNLHNGSGNGNSSGKPAMGDMD